MKGWKWLERFQRNALCPNVLLQDFYRVQSVFVFVFIMYEAYVRQSGFRLVFPASKYMSCSNPCTDLKYLESQCSEYTRKVPCTYAARDQAIPEPNPIC